MGQLDEILLESLTIMKNTSFYRLIWAKLSDQCISSFINCLDAFVMGNHYD